MLGVWAQRPPAEQRPVLAAGWQAGREGARRKGLSAGRALGNIEMLKIAF